MSKKKQEKLTPLHLLFLLYHAAIDGSILYMPRIVGRLAKESFWLIIASNTFIWALATYLIIKINSLFPQDSLIEYSQKIVGSILGKIISVSFIAYCIMTTAITTRLFATATASFSLQQTPISVTMTIILIITFYLAIKGLTTLGNLFEFLFFALSPAFMIIIISLFEINLLNLQPLINIDWPHFFEASYKTIFGFIGPEILFILYPYIKQKEKIPKYSYIALTFVSLKTTFVAAAAIGLFGVGTIQYLTWPVLDLLKSIEVPFFGRLEYLFIFFWVAYAFTTIAIYYFVANLAIKDLITTTNTKINGLFLLPLTFYLAFLPKNLTEIFNYVAVLGMIGVLFSIFIPLILLVINYFKGAGNKK